MRIKYFLFALLSIFLFSSTGMADARLNSKLGLSPDQAAKVQAIQKKYRKQVQRPRQEYNRITRAQYRAERANDTAKEAQLKKEAEKYKLQVRSLKKAEQNEIRAVLNAEQKKKYEAELDRRRNMAGSNRDFKKFGY